MLEAVGHAVSRLIRIRYGAMALPRGLKRGAWMELDDSDIRALSQAAGGARTSIRGEAGSQDGNAAGPGGRPSGAAPRRGGRTGGPRGANNGQRNGAPSTQRGPRPDGPRGGPRGGNGRGDSSQDRRDGAGQPDPMKTSFGYIGADSFTKQRQEQGQRPRGGPGAGRRGGRSR
jgi:23S rRNA pseudouridine2605 synthase